jgi:hypothetical protein
VVQAKAIKLEARIRSALSEQGYIDLHHGFRAISVDVITDYAFDNCYGFLEQDDFGVAFFNMVRDFGPGFWFFQQFPALQPIAFGLPFWLVKMIDGPLKRMMMLQNVSICISRYTVRSYSLFTDLPFVTVFRAVVSKSSVSRVMSTQAKKDKEPKNDQRYFTSYSARVRLRAMLCPQ